MKITHIEYEKYCPCCLSNETCGFTYTDGFYGSSTLHTCAKCKQKYVVSASYTEDYICLKFLLEDKRIKSVTVEEK